MTVCSGVRSWIGMKEERGQNIHIRPNCFVNCQELFAKLQQLESVYKHNQRALTLSPASHDKSFLPSWNWDIAFPCHHPDQY